MIMYGSDGKYSSMYSLGSEFVPGYFGNVDWLTQRHSQNLTGNNSLRWSDNFAVTLEGHECDITTISSFLPDSELTKI